MKRKITALLLTTVSVLNIFLSASFAKNDLPVIYSYESEAVQNGGYVSFEDIQKGNIYVNTELKESVLLPAYYSSAEQGYISGVKNQSTTGTCWAFTQNELIETFMKKNTGVSFDLSEENMKFETSYRTNTQGGFAREINGGGNEFMSTAYLARGGTVLEEDEPFTTGTTRYVDSDSVEHFGYLKNALFIEGEGGYDAQAIQTVKELVYEYGAVGAGLYYAQYSGYEDLKRNTYYYNGDADYTDHAVTIVGWDDNYSKNNFMQTPEGDGAFIVKNSWGKYHSSGTSDLVYVSYYDKFITSQCFVSEFYADEKSVYDRVYQYDYYGYSLSGKYWLSNTSEVVCANRFESETFEAVNAVSTYTVVPGTTIEVYIDTNGGEQPSTEEYALVHTETFEYAGYHMVSFDPVHIMGDGFTVAIRYKMPSGMTEAYIPLQTARQTYSPNATNTPDTSYIGSRFSNLYPVEYYAQYNSTYAKAMVCIKAFTEDTCAQNNHFYTAEYDGTYHWQQCRCGDITQKTEHIYDNSCDTSCADCDFVRTVTHSGESQYDDTYHWQQCGTCKTSLDKTMHVYDNVCDKTCNDCAYERQTTHHYDILKDQSSHWYECEFCQATKDKISHIYDNAFDELCEFCQYRRTAPNTPAKTFVDVPANAWYKYYVDYAVAYGLYKGTSDKTFSPDGEMTRAQFVQVLANLSGANTDNNVSSGFKDVPKGQWYTGAVKWAADNGVAKGMGGGKFSPNGKIDRQQMCVMLVNYVENYKKSSLNQYVAYMGFADEGSIASWSRSAVEKCYRAGLVKGTSGGKFSPLAIATRKEGATVFTNFHKDYIAQ